VQDIIYIKAATSYSRYSGIYKSLFLLPEKSYFYSNFKDFNTLAPAWSPIPVPGDTIYYWWFFHHGNCMYR